jgi:pimeloyl-ACP methyl ester carboxylesterase
MSKRILAWFAILICVPALGAKQNRESKAQKPPVPEVAQTVDASDKTSIVTMPDGSSMSFAFNGSRELGAALPRLKASQGKSRYASLDGTRIHYKSYGKGREALVLIHGWTGNLELWREQVPDLEKRARVIAVDLPGHGQSDKPEIAYTQDLFARAVDAVLRHAGVDRAVLVGHSMGTPVARQFYRKYPKKTLAIVIVDGALRPFGDRRSMELFIKPLRGPNYREAASGMFAAMLGPQVLPQVRDQITASFLNTPQYVLLSAMEGMADESIWGQDKINVPVLAILAKSPFWPADTEQFYRSIAPKIDYEMWDGVGHFLMMEKPKQFNNAVIGFLDKNGLLKK